MTLTLPDFRVVLAFLLIGGLSAALTWSYATRNVPMPPCNSAMWTLDHSGLPADYVAWWDKNCKYTP